MTNIRPSHNELKTVADLLNPAKEPSNALIRYSQEQLLGLLDYHGVTMLTEHFGTLPKALKPIITQRKAMMVANDTLKQTELIALFDAFERARLPKSILFKGGALAYTVYPKPWLRPRSDSDILIKQEQRAEFDRVFIALGYHKQFAMEGKYVSYQSTYSKALVGKSAINIDLHWRINNRQILANSFNVDELHQQGQALQRLSSNITIPSPVHSVLISSVHRLGHHQHEERLTWLYDIHLLADNLSERQWQQLINQAKTKQLSAITLDALKHCDELFSTPIPDFALTQLSNNSQNTEPSQLFLQRDLPEWTLFWHDLKALPSTRAKVGFLVETTAPSPRYIRQQMNTKYALWGYMKRFFRGLKRFL